MAYQSMWTHGSTAVPINPGGAGLEGLNGHRLDQVNSRPWTDLTGVRTATGAIFQANGDNSNGFTFSIPTPAFWSAGGNNMAQARLFEIFLLYRTTGGASITGILVTDGGRILSNVIGETISDFGRLSLAGDFHPGSRFVNPVSSEQLLSLFVLGETVFRIGSTGRPAPQNNPEIFFGVGIQVGVAWSAPGSIEFAAAGAGFFVL